MAKKFKSFETRDKPKKRGARQHKKNKNKHEKIKKSPPDKGIFLNPENF